MLSIAILGATSEIAKDLILSFAKKNTHSLALFARRPEAVKQWLVNAQVAHSYEVYSFEQFKITDHYDAIINFVGVGNPAKIATLGSGIFDITWKYDNLALQYIEVHPACKYLFLSSGAAYCSTFEEPANDHTKANLDLNHIKPQDWYGVAKLHAECRHRALPHLSIVDLRVFNYFSHTQDMAARFLMTDVVRAIKNKTVLETSSIPTMRDYLHHADFHQLVSLILISDACNTSVDCYSRSPIDKFHLLKMMRGEFGLIYTISNEDQGVKSTGNKPCYFSENRKAEHDFKYTSAYSSESTLIEQTRLSLSI